MSISESLAMYSQVSASQVVYILQAMPLDGKREHKERSKRKKGINES